VASTSWLDRDFTEEVQTGDIAFQTLLNIALKSLLSSVWMDMTTFHRLAEYKRSMH